MNSICVTFSERSYGNTDCREVITKEVLFMMQWKVSPQRSLCLRQLSATSPQGGVPAKLCCRPTERSSLCPLQTVWRRPVAVSWVGANLWPDDQRGSLKIPIPKQNLLSNFQRGWNKHTKHVSQGKKPSISYHKKNLNRPPLRADLFSSASHSMLLSNYQNSLMRSLLK